MTTRDILDRLADLARQVESHEAAIFLLKRERAELQASLRGAGWTPPPLPEKTR